MIINGGMGYIVPDLLQQMEEFDIDETRITKLLILHSHFDHVGIIPFLKRRTTNLVLYGSARAGRILQKPKAIDTINKFSFDMAKRAGRGDVCAAYDLEWRDLLSVTTVSEGDVIDLGGVKGSIIETPGHSSCSIAFYVPQHKALFGSDGAGIPYKDTIVTSANSNFTKYQESLEKLKDLDVEYVCADHYGYISGIESRDFIRHSIDAARDYRSLLEDVYQSEGNIDAAVKKLFDAFWAKNENYFLSPQIMEGVLRQTMRHIADVMENQQ
jgi:glyoxylase-like metal-dependent hydrolase (beta-lactamase superfamily II)